MNSRNPAGRPLGDRCSRGHDFAITRRRRSGTQETYCTECRKEYNREALRLPRHVAEMRALLRDGLAVDAATEEAREWQRRVFEFFGRVRARRAA